MIQRFFRWLKKQRAYGIAALSLRITTALVVGLIFAAQPTINAISSKALSDVLNGWPNFASERENECGTGTAPAAGSGGNKLYVLGDSLTVGMRDSGSLQEKLETNGWSITKINAIGGKDLSWGLEQIKADAITIGGSNAILIGLGTNNLANTVNVNAGTEKEGGKDWIKGKMEEMMTELKKTAGLKIYWTDTYGKGEYPGVGGTYNEDIGYGIINAAISEEAAANGITVLPWSTSSQAAQYITPPDVHPNGNYPGMADFITDQMGAAATGPSSGTPVTVGSKLFYIGDSLTYHLGENDPDHTGNLLQKSVDAGYTVSTDMTTVPSDNAPRIYGPSIEAQGSIAIAGTLPHLEDHLPGKTPPAKYPTGYADADIIVIALGTNKEQSDYGTAIKTLVSTIKTANDHALIYWVNAYWSTAPPGTKDSNGNLVTPTKQPYTAVNQVIDSLDKTKSADGVIDHVIDYASAALADSGIAPDGSDGVHVFNTAGRLKKADFIISQLPKPGSTFETDAPTGTTTGGGCCAVGGSADGTLTLNTAVTYGAGVWTTGSVVYQSGLSAPYTIEDWAISVMRAIAKKAGLADSVIVTQEKVLALVAWAKTEGGGYDGHNGTYNPLNTKRVDADVHGTNQGNAGNDSNSSGYPSFDQGVEATVRALFTTVQSRIGSALLDPSATAEDIVVAATGDFYSPDGHTVINNLATQYPGNLAWATGSITGYHYSDTGVGDRTAHLNSKMSVLKTMRETGYSAFAAKVLDGADRKPEPGTPRPLVYTGTGTTGEPLPGVCTDATAPGGGPAPDLLGTDGVFGWDLPNEGANPLKYYYSQLTESSTKFKGYTDYFGDYTYSTDPGDKNGACGPTAAAHAVSNLTGTKVTVREMGDWFIANGYNYESGSNSNLFADPAKVALFAAKWGVTSRRIDASSSTAIADEIKAGHFVVVSLSSPSPLVTGDAHITTIRAVTTDGKFLFADSSDSFTKANRGNIIASLGSSRTPMSLAEFGPIRTGAYAFEKVVQ